MTHSPEKEKWTENQKGYRGYCLINPNNIQTKTTRRAIVMGLVSMETGFWWFNWNSWRAMMIESLKQSNMLLFTTKSNIDTWVKKLTDEIYRTALQNLKLMREWAFLMYTDVYWYNILSNDNCQFMGSPNDNLNEANKNENAHLRSGGSRIESFSGRWRVVNSNTLSQMERAGYGH
jgi:hypothetical protein